MERPGDRLAPITPLLCSPNEAGVENAWPATTCQPRYLSHKNVVVKVTHRAVHKSKE